MYNEFHRKRTLGYYIQMLYSTNAVVQCVTVALMEYCFRSVQIFLYHMTFCM